MVSLLWLLVVVFFVLSLAAAVVTTIFVWVQRNRFPRVYGLLVIIIFSFLYIFNLESIHKNANSPLPIHPPQQVEDTFVADLYIQTSVNLPVIKDQSTQVNVFILQFGQSQLSPSSALQPTVGLTPVGTPKVPIIKAFGPGEDVSAMAQLNVSSFDKAPQGQQEQSLDQPSDVNFDWTITPKFTGRQVIEVIVIGKWVPKTGGIPIERPLAKQSLYVYVRNASAVEETAKPFFTFGQLDVSQLLVVLLGSALNIPWIIELFKKRRVSRKQEQNTVTQSSHIASSPSSRKKRGKK